MPRQSDDDEDEAMKKLMTKLNDRGITLVREVINAEKPRTEVKAPLRGLLRSKAYQTVRQEQSNLASDRCVNCRKRKYPTLFSNKPEPLDGERTEKIAAFSPYMPY